MVPRSKSRGRAVTVKLCVPCHRYIHKNFSNVVLRDRLSSVEKLRANPKVKRFTRWVSKR
ncbi:MAG: hypothetical protein DRO11_01975 [Methanobacteriota archaeon]|nr:MAG: hypothetical protein DRO11_01975 [Euryarchaeota archaeon]